MVAGSNVGSLLTLASIAGAFPFAAKPEANAYAPYDVHCFFPPFVRPARGLSLQERAYVWSRSRVASANLVSWVETQLNITSFEDSCRRHGQSVPSIAIASSGGGAKGGLISAGVFQGFDSRDTSGGLSGILQSSTYYSALSGSSLTLSGVLVNDFAQVSSLKSSLYNQNYQNPFVPAVTHASQVEADISAKAQAGYPATLVDIFGRVISWAFINDVDGAPGATWSNVASQSSFAQHAAPYPIITTADANVAGGQCAPDTTGAIWEWSPYDFGSWDSQVNAFFPTKYVGTSMNGGWPARFGTCTQGFDNAGFITGMSSNIVANLDGTCSTGNETQAQLGGLAQLIESEFPANNLVNPYGIIPNPFYNSRLAGSIRDRPNLYMVDGGYTGQPIPIFPFLQPERSLDVIFAIDVESQVNNITDGSGIYNTSLAAHARGLTRMPQVPSSLQFLANGLEARADFYGCHDRSKATIILIPDSTERATEGGGLTFSAAQVQQIFEGGIEMTTQSGDKDWPACVACVIIHKSVRDLPSICGKCLEKYCYKG